MIRFETNLGDFTIELFEEKAPLSVANFLQYIDDGHFDGTIFHRIVPGFVIQGGGFTENMTQKKTQKDNDFLDHSRGNFGYAVFARVTDGMDVVDKIAAVKTGRKGGFDDVPVEPIVMKSVKRTDD